MSVKDSKPIKGKTNVKKIKKIRVLIHTYIYIYIHIYIYIYIYFITSSSKHVTKNYSNS